MRDVSDRYRQTVEQVHTCRAELQGHKRFPDRIRNLLSEIKGRDHPEQLVRDTVQRVDEFGETIIASVSRAAALLAGPFDEVSEKLVRVGDAIETVTRRRNQVGELRSKGDVSSKNFVALTTGLRAECRPSD